MPTGLGDEQLWLCPTLDNVTPFNDLSDQANNGTAVGGLSTVADTSNGGAFAYDLDGTDDYISVPSGLACGTGDITMSAWFNTTSTTFSAVVSTFLGNNAGTTTNGVALWQRNNGVYGAIADSVGRTVLTERGTTSINSWHNLCVTFDRDGNASTYLDGILLGVSSISSRSGTIACNPLFVGKSHVTNGTPEELFDGKIDDVRVYDRTLTQAEIAHLAEARGITGSPPQGLGDEKLWLCPSINNSPNDISGNGNNGVYGGGVGTISDTSNGGSLCYGFDGADDYVQVSGTGFNFLRETNSWTQCCWIKFDAASTNGAIFGGQGGTVSHGNVVYNASSSLGIRGLRAAGTPGVYSPNVQTNTQVGADWCHICWVCDGNVSTVYKDGVSIGSQTGTFTTSTGSTSDILLGASLDGGTKILHLAGRVDDARVYNRPITQAEITHLATSRGIEGPPPVGLGDEQLWWSPSLSQSVTLDSSAYGKTVSSIGTAPTLVADTDAGGQYAAQIPNNGAVRVLDPVQFMTTGDCSSSGWIKASLSSTVTMIAQQASGAASLKSGVLIDQYLGQNRAKFFDGINENELLVLGGNTTPDNTWYHIATTKEGSTCKLFVNGVLLVSGTQLGIPSSPDYKDLLIGGLWNGANPLYGGGGYIDDVRLYDRAITQAEITHLATSRGVEGGPSTCGLITDMAYWSDFDDAASSMADENGGSDTLDATLSPAVISSGSPRSSDCTNVVNAYYSLNSGANQPAPPSDYSFSIWARCTGTGSTGAWIAGQRQSTAMAGWNVFRRSSNGLVVFMELAGGVAARVVEVTPMSLNTWYLLSFSRTDAGLYGYVNGSLVGSDTTATTQGTEVSPMRIGGASWDPSNAATKYNGYLWSCGMWDRELTSGEHLQLYANGQGLLYSEICPTPPTTQYNAFTTHAFTQLFQQRLR